MTDEPELAIGVDGGASGVRALAVRRRDDGLLEARREIARRNFEPFDAPDLVEQRAAAKGPLLGAHELAAGRARVRAAAEAILEAASGHRRLRLAICWPGTKTARGDGVVVARNGPRIPGLIDMLRTELAERAVELAAPIPPLASDGVAGALGERWSSDGLLRDVENALYFAGGSGLAESLLVAGRVRSLDERTPPVPKAFELAIGLEPGDVAVGELSVYEDVLSPGRWSRPLGLGAGAGPVDWAEIVRVDRRRIDSILRLAATALVRYIEDRMRRLRDQDGTVPERAVVGARLGQLIALPEARAILHDRIVACLQRAGLPADFVRASTRLEAPCFGAAALALGLEGRACLS